MKVEKERSSNDDRWKLDGGATSRRRIEVYVCVERERGGCSWA